MRPPISSTPPRGIMLKVSFIYRARLYSSIAGAGQCRNRGMCLQGAVRDIILPMNRILTALVIVLMLAGDAISGGAMPLEKGREMMGLLTVYTVKGTETLHEVALDHRIGYNEIADANPALDPWVPKQGQTAVVPTMWILPAGPRKGIVVNLAEMRLYYFWKLNGRNVVSTYPVGVGVDGSETPLGKYKVIDKFKNPSWLVPKSIRRSEPGLPRIVPPGKDNPLGDYAMLISRRGHLIHGTNAPFGIGRRVSHGCIRLYPGDIRELFTIAPRGVQVQIVYQPVKVAVRGQDVYIEVHKDYMDHKTDTMKEAVAILKKRGLADRVNRKLLKEAVKKQFGYPVKINR